MEIVRNPDGSLVVPVASERQPETDGDVEASPEAADADERLIVMAPETRVLHPGEGGYDAALAEWDHQQNPDRAPVISTATGREEAMTVVHAVATSPDHAVAPAVQALDHPEASGAA